MDVSAVHRRPNARRRQRHVDMRHIGVAPAMECIDHRVHHGGRRPDGSSLATSLNAKRVVRARRDAGVINLVHRQIIGARHGVIHEARGEELTIVIIGAVLKERLADALGETPMDLPIDDHWVDDIAEVVRGRKAHDRDLARLRIDLHLTGIAAGRIDEVRRIVERGLLQARLNVFERVVVRHISRERDVAPGDGLVCARHRERAVFQFDVAVGRFKQVCRDLLHLVDDFLGRAHQGRAAHGNGTGAVRAHTHRRVRGIAMDNLDHILRQASHLGDHLREGRLVALSVAVGTGHDDQATGGVHPNRGALPQARRVRPVAPQAGTAPHRRLRCSAPHQGHGAYRALCSRPGAWRTLRSRRSPGSCPWSRDSCRCRS